MSSIRAELNQRFSTRTYLGLALFMASVCFMSINSQSVTSGGYVVGMAVALASSFLMPIGAFCSCVFFTIPFTAVLKLPIEAFSFMTLLQVLLIARTCFGRYNIQPIRLVTITLAAIATQLVPVVAFDQTVTNIILLILNLFTFYCIYLLSKSSRLNISVVLLSFALGVLFAGLIAQNYGIYVSAFQDYRFCGMWTDPNFWGMFCLLGIITCLIMGFQKPVRFIILAPIIVGLAMQGFLTLSRTFIVVCSLMVSVITFSYLRNSVWASMAVMAILAVGIVYALPYATDVFAERGLNDNDISNGRYDNTIMILEHVVNNPTALLFGFGYYNELNVVRALQFGHLATHNTYADLFAEFGLITDIILLLAVVINFKVIRRYTSRLYSLPGLVICVLLFYMGTLSMLKYSLLYLFFGLYCGYANNSKLSKDKL